MRQLPKILFFCTMLLGLSSFWVVPSLSQSTYGAGVRYFPATGHNVQGEFLVFFDRYGGEAIFGLPRTEEFFQDGLKVQYFQRARMEFHPRNPPYYQVQLSLLGDLLGHRMPSIPSFSIPVSNHPQRRYYPQTGHTLSYAFLLYFDSHGGLDIFGYPITELLMEQGTVVQYFQRAKMEWHPENPISHQITLGNLGDEYIARTNLPQIHLNPVSALTAPTTPTPEVWSVSTPVAPATPAPDYGQPTATVFVPPLPIPTTDFSVSASVKYPITGQGGYQTVYVRVMDDWGQAVRDAAVEIVVHFRSGDQVFHANSTDASGFSSFTFSIGYPPAGYTVLVDVRATLGGRTKTGRTSFIPWW
jgi:hypothetical protein